MTLLDLSSTHFPVYPSIMALAFHHTRSQETPLSGGIRTTRDSIHSCQWTLTPGRHALQECRANSLPPLNTQDTHTLPRSLPIRPNSANALQEQQATSYRPLRTAEVSRHRQVQCE